MNYTNWVQQKQQIKPHKWQQQLGACERPQNRLIRIPTGMGKTLGVITAWLYNRVIRADDTWPRRLVWCLPMRVLTEQTAQVAKETVTHVAPQLDIHVLMGGEDTGDWHLYPEKDAIIIGTQDMLLSRVLNRGYAAPRARWPMEYALLNQDALWVFDEVQLMDVGLITSVQMQAFRNKHNAKSLRPVYSWWMSATLQPQWLQTVDAEPMISELSDTQVQLTDDEQTGSHYTTEKELTQTTIPQNDVNALTQLVFDAHANQEDHGWGCITLVICNTVDRALTLFQKLKKKTKDTEIRLVHSRFREKEKASWAVDFLHRDHCCNGANRIIVATQVVEAGVDISANVLITELAPWASLIQRFGRCARYGGSGRIIVVDRNLTEKNCAPYPLKALKAAGKAISELHDASIKSLETYESKLSATSLQQLYPYEYLHLLTERDAMELFDTSPDLTGADTDISRFIRDDEERDLQVFWADLPRNTAPALELQPTRDALCTVSIGRVRQWLFDKSGKSAAGQKAWYWDYLDSRWVLVSKQVIRPGLTILVAVDSGGYHSELGFTGDSKHKAIDTTGTFITTQDLTDEAQSCEDRSHATWKTIASHGNDVADQLSEITKALLPAGSDLQQPLYMSARLHDWGKTHPAFQSSMTEQPDNAYDVHDLAKAPQRAWIDRAFLYCNATAYGPRKGFRHELAGALACFAYLKAHAPNHPALLGNLQSLIDIGVLSKPFPPISQEDPLDITEMSESMFNLMTYLVCSHHGKVRGEWQMTPQDQSFPLQRNYEGEGPPLRGVRHADALPDCRFIIHDKCVNVGQQKLELQLAAAGLSSEYGKSYLERASQLLDQLGPFTLAYLETLVRAADCRASKLTTDDPLLTGGNK